MSTHTHYDAVLARLKELMSQALPHAAGEEDLEIPFLEMGANSLMLMDVQKTIESDYGLTITIGQFFEELTNIKALVHYIDEELQSRDQESFSVDNVEMSGATGSDRTVDLSQTNANGTGDASGLKSRSLDGDYQPPMTFPALDIDGSGEASGSQNIPSNDLEAIFANQIRITSEALNDLVARQLAFLQGTPGQNTPTSGHSATSSSPSPSGGSATSSSSSPGNSATPSSSTPGASSTSSGAVSTPVASSKPSSAKKKGASQPNKMLSPLEIRARGLSPEQQTHLETLIKEFNARTAKSKAYAQRYRGVLADSRAAIGFRFSTKEMLYPLVADRASGSRIWDLDGNEYIDITMGQGVSLFGHHPEMIEDALRKEGSQSVQLGPRPHNTGELAELICEMTGFDRAAFTNTGTEAVMAAIRLVRAATGRTKIVMFEGAYHGHADSVMGASAEKNGQYTTQPISPGTPQGAVDDLWVLPYDEPETLEFIRQNGASIAAVFVEPVQSRNPGLQPREFLHDLRKLTSDSGSLLVFDEMITGFRTCPGGAQEYFGVRADLATYGKVLGGGMPIGVVAGKANLMDPLDGGAWQYGDNSYPEINRIVFGGTFCQHPLAMTASLATLRHLKEQGPGLQNDLNEKTAKLATELNEWFEKEQVPMSIVWFGSLFRFDFSTNLELLFYHMNLRGIFVWEWRNCFLSTAHTNEDIARVIQVVKESVLAMREGGFIPPKAGHYPLNSAQRQLATLAEITPEGSRAYHVSAQLSISGAIDENALSDAIDRVVERHEALRSVIQGVDRQKVLPAEKGVMESTDLSSKKNIETKLHEWLREFAGNPMDLEKGPLFRANLVKTGPQDHRLILKGHHIIMDGLSMNLIVSEIAQYYSSVVTGNSLSLPAAMQYREYLQWQQSHAFEAQQAYWLEKMSGDIPALELPSDKPESASRSYRGGRISKQIDTDLFSEIQSLSRKSGVTHFMTLFAMYALWLHRLSGQDELIIGMPVAGRSLKGAESLVGYCTHLIPIHSRVDWNEPFSSYLKRMRGNLLKGYEHQDYPFSRLIEKLNSQRNGRQGSIIQTVFNLDRPGDIPAFEGLDVSWLSQPVAHMAFDFVFNLTEIGKELVLECDYNDDRFERSSVDLYTDCFVTLAESIVENPELSLAAVPMMSDDLRNQWLVEWNNTAHPYGEAETVNRLFETCAEKHAKKTALTFDGGKLTYSELNREANRLAHYLKENGADTDKVVAICLNRSPELIISILAVLKSGAAYLPLDPDYPAARLSYMMEDAQPVILITESKSGEKISSSLDVSRLLIDGVAYEGLASQSDKNPEWGSGPEDLAYILYTSGSTGQPKGTMVHHKGMVNYLSWAVDYYGTAKGAGSPLHSSIGFDATLTSLFSPLLSGRTLHLLPNEGVEIEHITSAMTGSGKKKPDWSLVKLTPSHMELLNEMIPDSEKAGLTRSIVLGGEALTGRAIKPWRESAPETKIVNEYGPTETVVGCAIYEEQRSDPGSGPVPIGRPVWNTRLYVLDKNGYPVPPGVEGELYIGGDGVARGYVNRPDLTKERFIDITQTGLVENGDLQANDQSSGGLPSDRLYRTGDRVKLLADGNLVFLGRYDNQLKLRGHRIEPAEIEAALVEVSGVREAVIMLKENSSHQFLVAYIVVDSAGNVNGSGSPAQSTTGNGEGVLSNDSVNKSGGEAGKTDGSDEMRTRLRTALRNSLPEHMIPSQFIPLEKIPLNQNGKVDYASLPEVISGSERGKSGTGSALSSPRGEAEQRIASIWCELLDIETVGRDDNFFDVGGHSLLVLPLRDRLASEFNCEVKPADIFQYTTVATTAAWLAPATRPGSDETDGRSSAPEMNGKLAPVATGRKRRSSAKRKKKKDDRRS